MSLALRKFLLLTTAGLWLAGCKGYESTPPPETEAIGRLARQQVQDFIASAKNSPAQASQQLERLNESLEAYANDYGGEFEPLKDEAFQLLELYQKDASQPEIETQLLKLNDAADALPG